MTVTGQQIVDKAREYLGTPFKHQGRVKGVGVDCIGLLMCVCRELGLKHHDHTGYKRIPDGTTLDRELAKSAIRTTDPQIGDIMTLWFYKRGFSQHAAIITNVGIIHAYSPLEKVVETGMSDYMTRRIVGYWRFLPGGYPIPIDFDPEQERRRLQQGGCCGAP